MAETRSHRSTVLKIAESILNLLALPLGMVSLAAALLLLWERGDFSSLGPGVLEDVKRIYSPSNAAWITFVFLQLLSGARIVRGYRLRREKGEGFFRLCMAQAAVYAAAGLLIPALGYSARTTLAAAVLCAAALIAGRVWSIVRDHRLRNVLLNVAAAAVVCFCAFNFLFMAALLAVIAIVTLLGIVFSRISYSVLRKIIIRTHASEIICGLFLLVLTFSILLAFFEPGIGGFGNALWYCFAIVTTIGFGDVAAVTVIGRILSVILGAYGIVVVALITSIIVNFYGEMKASPEGNSGDAQEEQGQEQG